MEKTKIRKTSCNGSCVIDQSTGVCKGCYRTMREIIQWHRYTPEEKERVYNMADRRREEDSLSSH